MANSLGLIIPPDSKSLLVHYPNGNYETYGGNDSNLTLKIKDAKIIPSILLNPNLGFSEAYMNGKIDYFTPDGNLDELIKLFFNSNLKIKNKILALPAVIAWFFKHQWSLINNNRILSRKNVTRHYDHPSELYQYMLDPNQTGNIQYSCAFFPTADSTLVEAQNHKSKVTLDKLNLQPGDKVLDIGCGFGGLGFYALNNYPGITYFGITTSPKQYQWVIQKIAELKIQNRFFIKLLDWRDLRPGYINYPKGWPVNFDKIVSVGMFEHVGKYQSPKFCRLCYKLLKSDGLFLLHTIVRSSPTLLPDTFVLKYIFPGSDIPVDYRIMDWLSRAEFKHLSNDRWGEHYAQTLIHWRNNFREYWIKIIEPAFRIINSNKDPAVFKRMWELYLAGSIVCFQTKHLNLAQFLVKK